MRNIHKEQIMQQLQQNFQAHSVLFNVSPDYSSLLSKKFSSSVEEQEILENARKECPKLQCYENEEDIQFSDDEEDNEVPSLARGRKLTEAACLRISKIEKVLANRDDLTKEERRSLRARKNTANFRERRKKAQELKYFINIELDVIQNAVSQNFYSQPLN